MSEQANTQQPPSTLQSYINSASGAVQSAIGGLTGNTAQKAEGEAAQKEAQTEHEQSKAAVKVAGYSVSTDGGIAKDHEDRAAGSWNQTLGSAKEAVGGLIRNEVCFPYPILSSQVLH